MKIFFSYRRDDSSYIVDRIYRHIIGYCDEKDVFRDIGSINPGVDFRDALVQAMLHCDALLAVIGARWLTVADGEGRPRLHSPEDYVRVEIETALRRSIPVIPLLTENASLSDAENLPDSISALRYRQSLVIRQDPDFTHDMDRLVEELKKYGLESSLSKPNTDLGFGNLGL